MNLYYSIASNNFNGIKITLDKNPSLINQLDNYGRPNFYYAIAYGDLKMLKLLLSYNPDLTIKDMFGLTPTDYAYLYDKQNSTNYLNYLNHLNKDKDKYESNNIENKINDAINKYENFFLGTLHLNIDSDSD